MNVPTYPAPLRAPRHRSLLKAHARWILAVALVAVAGACLLSWQFSDHVYRSEARVLVNPGLTPGGTPLPPDMETERQVVASAVVTSEAARGSGTSTAQLQRRLTTSVPADSSVLVLRYSDTSAETAQRRAQAIADAYLAYRAPQVAMLSAATLPRSATGPNYLLNGAAGLALGLLLGVGSALLRDRLDDAVRGPRDFIEQTDLPVLATVRSSDALGADGSGGLVVLDEPDSPAAEAHRQLRRKVGRAAHGRHRTTTVTLVTSAARDDGAAQVAANTAVALAQAGAQVLLVEGDLRTPRLAGLFDVPAEGGLGVVLTGEVGLAEAVRDSRVDRLRLLPAGAEAVPRPWELFDDEAVEKLLSQVPADVDHVVLHAPPVLGAAETCVLAEHAHLLVIVVATGRTGRHDLGTALTELDDVRAALLGGVLVLHDGPRGDRRPVRPPRRRGNGAPARSAVGHADPAEDLHGGEHRAEDARRGEEQQHDRITNAG
ncbi:hypothetical protein [Geodermatophilus maliterrae]|uniref:Capsular exopolysaccharide family n=1 Tax=Geodermatophilus maliterrae TaxID=3162531 RepID=A0ABV3XDS2_9ACTN